MPLPSPFRKAMLLTHILCSVGWIGAVAAFLVLALVGLYSSNVMEMRAVYMAMQPITTWLIVPLAFLSLVTGLVQALTTLWGLFRHYWIVFKFLINLLSLPILLLHTRIIHGVAGAATANTLSAAGLHEDRVQLVVASGAALVALILAALLSVYKPKGRIRQS
jgi:hypothetical protein